MAAHEDPFEYLEDIPILFHHSLPTPSNHPDDPNKIIISTDYHEQARGRGRERFRRSVQARSCAKAEAVGALPSGAWLRWHEVVDGRCGVRRAGSAADGGLLTSIAMDSANTVPLSPARTAPERRPKSPKAPTDFFYRYVTVCYNF